MGTSTLSSARFVGRRDERAQLTRLLNRSRARQAAAVVVAGDAGIGETRLVEELAGATAIELARLVPELAGAAAVAAAAELVGAARARRGVDGTRAGVESAERWFARAEAAVAGNATAPPAPIAHRAGVRLDRASDRGHGDSVDVLHAHRLTRREREVLALVAEGRTDREIGQHLFISHRTVERHVSNILAKLGAATRSEATAIVHRAAPAVP